MRFHVLHSTMQDYPLGRLGGFAVHRDARLLRLLTSVAHRSPMIGESDDARDIVADITERMEPYIAVRASFHYGFMIALVDDMVFVCQAFNLGFRRVRRQGVNVAYGGEKVNGFTYSHTEQWCIVQLYHALHELRLNPTHVTLWFGIGRPEPCAGCRLTFERFRTAINLPGAQMHW
eukprot:m.919929 g.919929  ORF g.919929 m.919929 type:complete len:176 (+) comp60523_c0_seq1:1427-1954(+)